MDRLKGQHAIVTGGASGIGRACVERLAQAGAGVALFDIDADKGDALAGALTAKGLDVRFHMVDVTSEAEMKGAIDAVAAHFGGLDILVNNAGIAQPFKSTEHVTEGEWDKLFAVNVKSFFFGTKHSIPHLRAAGGGSIVNMCSICGFKAVGGIAPYHAAKGAVRLMTKNDARDYAPDGIRVNSVHPGFIMTEMTRAEFEAAGGDIETAKVEAAALAPLNRMGTPEDVANAVLFLASQEASFITGAELAVDGGWAAV